MINDFFYTIKQDVACLFDYGSTINPSQTMEEKAQAVFMRFAASFGMIVSSAYAARSIAKATSGSKVSSLLACTALFMLCHDIFLIMTCQLKNNHKLDNKHPWNFGGHAPQNPNDLHAEGTFYRPIWLQFENLA